MAVVCMVMKIHIQGESSALNYQVVDLWVCFISDNQHYSRV